MLNKSQIKKHMDVLSSDGKPIGQVDHLDGEKTLKLTKQSSPDGDHHHFIPVAWIERIDEHVHLSQSETEVKAHWQHEKRNA